jgi:quercetin dioxygenase-like cupin family protein
MTAEVPSERVGTEILFENDRVRVWEMALAPGESSEFHRHVHDYLFVYVTPTLLESRRDGGPPFVRSYGDGYAQYSVVGSAGLTHQVRNVGDEPHRQIIVEFLGESAASGDAPPAEANDRVADVESPGRG